MAENPTWGYQINIPGAQTLSELTSLQQKLDDDARLAAANVYTIETSPNSSARSVAELLVVATSTLEANDKLVQIIGEHPELSPASHHAVVRPLSRLAVLRMFGLPNSQVPTIDKVLSDKITE
ncbi:MAG: hypothetical protein ABIV43_01060 [Candidatus Saccharimonadales bacterium]